MYRFVLAAFLTLFVCPHPGPGQQTGRDLQPVRTGAVTRLPDGRTRWALIVGVSAYENLPPHAQLKYANRDAEDLARFLRSPEGGALAASHIRLLTDDRATLSSIRAALHIWLPQSVGPNDIVYIFIAGHGVLAEGNQGYFIAHDSDPQNLHATGLSFAEVNDTINKRLRADLVVLLADACHAGSVGWASTPGVPANAQEALQAIGAGDRSLLKLLASSPSEQSFEDARWDGGHGVFTYAVMRGLRGAAERDRDGVVRASELIEYLGRIVPEQTASRQNPRVAGNFEARLPLALTSGQIGPEPAGTAELEIRGQPGTAVYVDAAFRGIVRPTGELRVDRLTTGPHRVSLDLPGAESYEETVTVIGRQNLLNLEQLPGVPLVHLRQLVGQGTILGQNGALAYFRSQTFSPERKAEADAVIAGALEGLGQECVSDYVLSTTGGLKGPMLARAADAFGELRALRPFDRSIEARQKFCRARAQIAGGQFAEAERNLRESLQIDPSFACAHNALGVALARLNRIPEARASFQKAAELTPEWSLPFLQVGQMMVSSNRVAEALPWLEKAVKYNPKSVQARWNLLRGYRLANRVEDFAREANALIALDRNYAPTYLEIGTLHEARRDYEKAAQAFGIYVALAPNFSDSAQVRARAVKNRERAGRTAPSLLKK